MEHFLEGIAPLRPGAAEPGWSGVVGPPLELGIYKVNSGISVVCPALFIVFGPPLDKIHSVGPAPRR